MKSLKRKDFNWKTLLEGICNYSCWLIGCCCTVAGFNLFGGDLSITIEDNTYTLLQAVELAQKAVYAYWGAKAVENFFEYGGIKKTVKMVDTEEKIEEFNDTINISAEEEVKG